ncbi:tRNA (adenine(22)-N(1))-methyltransferase TrmK [Paucilactobacillus suebicus]|uniref:SAM-dependent methyltransferase n=1 Tax=Paucilactobacillus suebicus DSM 5007 = KCTC 3549 TaxID=1423807 RepID=A0A0R1W3L3_9LACO|nr:tRNA (adenine(22)-N(1))-methyltransferase TrmK [Paucilactobacillus suebicus]KRM12095.1 hypothetical protein FD16_GL000307 [Paucilactobacillus suebicus DSM 5007 = KCTC 3549]
MDARHLSKRLATVASFVPVGARLADIGSDHAYLPAALAIQNKIVYAVAGEVARGPFENALHEIKSQKLDHIINVRQADGLSAITSNDFIDAVTIAGMGGTLITKILSEGIKNLSGVKSLILQPNVGEFGLRQWLMNHQFRITNESILSEDGHTYEIIVAQPSNKVVNYSESQLYFGPWLLQQKNEVFKAKWREEAEHLRDSIEHMKIASNPPRTKITQFEQQIRQIQRVLE